jgi:CubicO group peptidase (beta-lactamase class C family)
MSSAYLLLHADNPYAEYGPEQLYDFLSHYELPRDIGAQYEYSNVGMGLLGHLLSLKAGADYETVVVNRICAPLRLNATRINLSPELKSRLAAGHDASGKAAKNWDFQVLAGCGALRSCVNDLLKFLSANMGLTPSPLSAAMHRTQLPRRDADFARKAGLGWVINADAIVWHNGATAGYHSFIGFNPRTRRGVVVLANSSNNIDSIGSYALGPARPHKLVAVDYRLYDHYIGKYDLAPGVALIITHEGDRLLAQMTGQSAFEVFPESETDFFYKVVDAQLSFVKTEDGKVARLVLHQNGLDHAATKEK